MAATDPFKINCEIFLEGEQVWNALIGLSVSTEVNRIPRARIELNYRQVEKNEGSQEEVFRIQNANSFDRQPKNVKADFLPGKEIQIRLGRGEGTVEVFRGYITRQNIEARSNGALILSLECRHTANRMTLHKRTRFFHHTANEKGSAAYKIDPVDDFKVLSHLVEQSADYGLSLLIEKVREQRFSHENMTQYNSSDWDFLIMRAEALGYVCLPEADFIHMFRPEVAESTDLEIQLGKDILEYEAVYDEVHRAEYNRFSSWEIDAQKVNLSKEKNSNIPVSVMKVQTNASRNHGGDISDPEAEAFLANAINRQELGKIRGTAKVKGTTEFRVGNTLSIAGFSSVWDRDTFVSGIKHELHSGTWHTHIQCGLPNQSHAEIFNLSAGREQDLMPRTSGLLYGKVKKYKRSEGGHELLEVEIPASGDGDTGSNQPHSIYARLATFSAGQNGGAVFRPWPEDEVVLGFIQDDPRFPVVLGSLFNGKDTSPFQWEDEDTQNRVGFSIMDWNFSVHTGDKEMVISSPKGQKIALNDDSKILSLAFDDQNQIKISGEGIEMQAKKIVLKGSTGIEMEGNEVTAKAKTTMHLEGGIKLNLEGKVSANLKGQITMIN